MDKFKLETSIQFPFFKMNELVTYSEVKKPSGVAYILLVLINESKDRTAGLSNLLENFGVPKNLQYIFADELEKLISQDILNCDGFYKNEFETYSIGYFRFTEKGKNVRKYVFGFKKFLREYTLINERKIEYKELFGNYIAYALSLGEAKVVEEFVSNNEKYRSLIYKSKWNIRGI